MRRSWMQRSSWAPPMKSCCTRRPGGPRNRIRRLGSGWPPRWLPASGPSASEARAGGDGCGTGDRVVEDWALSETSVKRSVEDSLADEIGLEPGRGVHRLPGQACHVPAQLLVERSSGQVERLGPAGLTGLIDLPRPGRGALHDYASSSGLHVQATYAGPGSGVGADYAPCG